MVLAASALAVAGCGGDDESSGSAGGNGSTTGTSAGGKASFGAVKSVITSGPDSGDIVGVTAPIEFGAPFGITQKASDIKRFDSHATAMQVLLSGGADVIGGSFISDLQLIQKGQDLKVFCPFQNKIDAAIVGVDKIKDLSQVKDPKTRVGVDSPGGAVNFFMNQVFEAKSTGYTVDDLKNVKILEDSSLRLSALQNGEIDAALIFLSDVEQLKKSIGADRVNMLSSVAEDVENGVFQVYAAKSGWIKDNADKAAAFCASVLSANKKLGSDFAAYKGVADKYIKPNLDEKNLQTTFQLASEHNFWPTEPVISKEAFEENVRVAVASGLLKPGLTYEQVFDPAPGEAAAKLLEGGA